MTCLLTRRGVALYISLSTGIIDGFFFPSHLHLPSCSFSRAVEYCFVSGYYRSVPLATHLLCATRYARYFSFPSLFFVPTLRFSRYDPLLKCEGNVLALRSLGVTSSFVKAANDATCRAIDLVSAFEIDLVWATTVLTSSLA